MDTTQLATTAAAAYFTGGASLMGGSMLGGGGGGTPPPSSSATGGKAEASLNEGSWNVTFAPGIGGYSGIFARSPDGGGSLVPLAALGVAASLVGVLLWRGLKKKG